MYMWKEVEHSIPIGMIFKKMYCQKCGEKLVKNKYANVILKGDPEYQKYGVGYFGDGKVTQYKCNYKCPNCGNIIEYKKQKEIAKIQKEKNTKILSLNDTEIDK